MDCNPPGSSVHEDSPGKDIALQADALPAELPKKPFSVMSNDITQTNFFGQPDIL